MEIKYDVSITAIGNLARTFLENNKSAILLDEGIRPNLSDMVIEHTPSKLEEDIKKGDKLLMGGSTVESRRCGQLTTSRRGRRSSSMQRVSCRVQIIVKYVCQRSRLGLISYYSPSN